jgi:hypothetical protein
MAQHTKRATCRLTAFGEAVLSFPYSAAMVAALKAAIPYRFRDWDPVGKTWTIDPAYVDVAMEMLLEHFVDAETPRRGRTRPTPAAPPAGNPFAVLHLLPSAPREVIDASFRALAKSCHPDAGGTDAAMRELTEAHDLLARRVGA